MNKEMEEGIMQHVIREILVKLGFVILSIFLFEDIIYIFNVN